MKTARMLLCLAICLTSIRLACPGMSAGAVQAQPSVGDSQDAQYTLQVTFAIAALTRITVEDDGVTTAIKERKTPYADADVSRFGQHLYDDETADRIAAELGGISRDTVRSTISLAADAPGIYDITVRGADEEFCERGFEVTLEIFMDFIQENDDSVESFDFTVIRRSSLPKNADAQALPAEDFAQMYTSRTTLAFVSKTYITTADDDGNIVSVMGQTRPYVGDDASRFDFYLLSEGMINKIISELGSERSSDAVRDSISLTATDVPGIVDVTVTSPDKDLCINEIMAIVNEFPTFIQEFDNTIDVRILGRPSPPRIVRAPETTVSEPEEQDSANTYVAKAVVSITTKTFDAAANSDGRTEMRENVVPYAGTDAPRFERYLLADDMVNQIAAALTGQLSGDAIRDAVSLNAADTPGAFEITVTGTDTDQCADVLTIILNELPEYLQTFDDSIGVEVIRRFSAPMLADAQDLQDNEQTRSNRQALLWLLPIPVVILVVFAVFKKKHKKT